MLNVVLVLILALHTAPYGLSLMENATYDLYVVTNIVVQVLLAGCLLAKATGRKEKIFSSLVLVVSIFFLLNYAINENRKEFFVFHPYKWVDHDNR